VAKVIETNRRVDNRIPREMVDETSEILGMERHYLNSTNPISINQYNPNEIDGISIYQYDLNSVDMISIDQ
jgi:hypothetical protein